jgi:predicted TIM-barrel fold metal-dependent hydrolase
MTDPANERLISVDSHVAFSNEWMKERLPSRLHPVWDKAAAASVEKEAQKRGHFKLDIRDMIDLEAARDPGHYEPHGKLKAMDRDGVEAEVIFPEVGGAKMCTPELMGDDWKECLTGYNKGMADFAAVNPERLLCAYQLMPFDPDFSVEEVQRVAKAGAHCVQLPPYPTEYGMADYHDRKYDKLWAALSETGLVVLNHLDTNSNFYGPFNRDPTPQKGIALGLPSIGLAETLAFWILTGTLERFPKLNVILVEPSLGWLPWFFETVLDGRMHQHYNFPGVKLLPSEYFKRQMGATFMYEPWGLKVAHEYFGPDVLYWSTDFPHPATCWPNSHKTVEEQFTKAGIPAADRKKIVCDNGLRTFFGRTVN